LYLIISNSCVVNEVLFMWHFEIGQKGFYKVISTEGHVDTKNFSARCNYVGQAQHSTESLKDLDKLNMLMWFGFRLEPIFATAGCPSCLKSKVTQK